MISENEIEVRTDDKDMLLCTAVRQDNGQVKLIVRRKEKEDTMPLNDFLTKIYGKSVAVMQI